MKARIRSIVRDAIRAIKINDGDVILIRSESRMAEHANFAAIAKYLGGTGRERCILVIADQFDDLKIADPDMMRKLGWVYTGPVEEEE